MASPTQDGSQVVATQTVTGGGDPVSGTHDKSGMFSVSYLMRISNGATAPDSPCEATVYYKDHNAADWYQVQKYSEEKAGGEVAEFEHEAPTQISNVKVEFDGNDTEDVTVEAVALEWISVG